jgi:hypothetical protein
VTELVKMVATPVAIAAGAAEIVTVFVIITLSPALIVFEKVRGEKLSASMGAPAMATTSATENALFALIGLPHVNGRLLE